MPAIRRRWTTADVRALTMEDRAWPRYELLDGELLVTPAPGSAHQFAVAEMLQTLSAYLDRHPIGVAVTSPADLELRPGSITQPDVFVIPADTSIAGEILQWPDVTRLRLAVEVLSPSTMRVDRVQKRDFYLAASVDEYWIVDLEERVIERWLQTNERPAIIRDQLEWPHGATEPLALDVRAYFDRVGKKLRLLRGGEDG